MSTSSLVGIATLIYLLASVGYMIGAATEARLVRTVTSGLAGLAIASHTAALTARVLEAGRPPLTNTYETLLLFAWVLALICLWWQHRYQVRVLGALALPIVCLLLAAASLPQIDADIEPLLPSLKSNWLLAHVTTCMIAYAAFGVAFATSIVFLVQRFRRRPAHVLAVFDSISYRAIALGYPLHTLGIITGAIWANSCWGRYWSWDPKETWAFVTWIIYSICLHLRFTAGWQGAWAAWAAIAGFLSVLFTYLGVNYLLEGLHSYA